MRIAPPHSVSQSNRLSFNSLIDVVFLLLVFFLMTFQITLPEGDFDVSRAEQGTAAGPRVPDLPLNVRLIARSDGSLAGILLHERRLPDADALGHEVRALLTSGAVAEPVKVHVQTDEHLRYEYTLDAIAAVSQQTGPDGRILALPTSVSLTTSSPR